MKVQCVNCNKWCYNPGEPAWSDQTPGTEASFECSEGMFSFSGYDITTVIFQRTLFEDRECDEHFPFNKEENPERKGGDFKWNK